MENTSEAKPSFPHERFPRCSSIAFPFPFTLPCVSLSLLIPQGFQQPLPWPGRWARDPPGVPPAPGSPPELACDTLVTPRPVPHHFPLPDLELLSSSPVAAQTNEGKGKKKTPTILVLWIPSAVTPPYRFPYSVPWLKLSSGST